MNKIAFIILFFCAFQIPDLFAQTVGTEIGDTAPEIRMASPKGDTIALSSLRGKMVLIDFWASWCPPCVEEQPKLVQLHKKYKDADFTKGKGFEIYGVSLDSKKANWEKIINMDGINWIQVSDLKFWMSPVAKLYKLQEVPYNLLIDGSGRILALNLHGNELEEVLGEVFGQIRVGRFVYAPVAAIIIDFKALN